MSIQLWAISPSAIQSVVDMLAGRAPQAERLQAPPPTRKGIAVIPIRGVLTNDGPAHFGNNYHGISTAVEQASADPNISRIVLHVDSPGGEVTGLPEAADVIAAAAKVKPVTAIVEGTSASAAYWLTSQAHDISLTPSGEVGSVGVRMMHVDASKAMADAGYTVTELQSGKHKTEWSPYKPLSKDAQDDMQGRLAAVHKSFTDAIAQGRNGRASAAIAKSRFGEGRMFSATDALAHGLIDKIQAPREFYRAIGRAAAPGDPRRARLELERLKVLL